MIFLIYSIPIYEIGADEVTKQLDKVQISSKQPEKKPQPQTTDPAKRLKNLKKRLREIEQLEEKLKNGQLTKPEPEQLTKIQRKNELLLQIEELDKVVINKS